MVTLELVTKIDKGCLTMYINNVPSMSVKYYLREREGDRERKKKKERGQSSSKEKETEQQLQSSVIPSLTM